MNVRSEIAAGGSLLDAFTAEGDFAPAFRVAAILFITVLTTVAAQISFPLPFTPVPFTLQPMVVLLGGAALGARLGATSQILYLLAGIAGLPVFAASPLLPQGIARVLGPTGGFLMSYPLAAFVAGALATRGFDRRFVTSILAMAAGLAVTFTCGVVWLAWGAPHVGLSAAIAAGFTPFIAADAVKVILAAAVLPIAWRFLAASR